MMMPRKKRRTLIVVSIIVLLLIVAVTLILLYINTDMFKSNATLFAKYIGQNMENVETFYNKDMASEYKELLKQSKYTTQTQVKVNYTENIGTTSESTQNSINQLKLKISGQTDKSNQYNYQDTNLLNNDEKVAKIEYIQRENIYGIKFSDLFNQYVLVENENLKELFEKVGYTQEELENIPDEIDFSNNLDEIFQFSDEEKQEIKTKYTNIVSNNVSKDNYSKQANQVIQINGKDISANAYVLTLTKEQLNNIYIKILEEVKQDEIILSRIDKIQTYLEKIPSSTETTNLKEEFTKEIDEIITDINNKNIGIDEVKIIVYESNKTTIKTVIQNTDYEIDIDLLPYQTEDYMQISYKNTTSGEEQVFTCKKKNEETSVDFKNTKDENTTEYSLVIDEKVDGNNCTKNIVAKYEDNLNKVEATIVQDISIVNSFENEVIFDENNSVNLSELDEEQVKSILEKVETGVSEQVDNITTNVLKLEDLNAVLKAVGIVKDQKTIESTGITETEKNRFNSKFEILQGEDLDGDDVLKLIDAIKENFVNMEVVSNTELKLKLDRLDKNEDIANTLIAYIENNKNRKYNAKVEYDEETGLVSDILLVIVEK